MRVALSLLLSTSLANAKPEVSNRDSVQQLATTADQAFQKGDVKAARDALLEAIALEPDNMKLVFGLAQAERFLGNCERAVELFERFLRNDPEPEQERAALEKRAECTDAPPPQPEPPPPEASPPPAEPRPDPVPAPPPDPPTRQVAGPVLVAVGAVLTIAGAALVATSFSRANRAPNEPTQEDYERFRDSSKPLAQAGWSTLGVGLGAAVSGGIVWGVQRSRGRRMLKIEARRVSP